MGDIRYERPWQRLLEAEDRAATLRAMSDEEVIMALAAARGEDPYLANVLASEAMNRVRRKGAIVETAAEGLLSQDVQGRLTSMNPGAERLLGWTEAELLGKDIHEVIHFQDAEGRPIPHAACPIWNVARTGVPVHRNEAVLTRKDGSRFFVEQNAAAIVRDGEIVGVVVTFFDITERKQAEADLRRLAAIVEASEDAIVLYSPEGVLQTWNHAAERIYGYSAAEMVGRNIIDLSPPEEREAVARLMAAAVRGEPVRGVEIRRFRKDGRPVEVALTISPLRDASGRVVALSGITRDITERKQAERAVRESEARKAAILAASLDAVITIDAQSRIIEWNPAAEQIFGHRAADVLGKDLTDIIIPERFREAHRRGMENYLRTGEGPVLGRRIRLPALRASGEEFLSEISILPIETGGRPLFTSYLREAPPGPGDA